MHFRKLEDNELAYGFEAGFAVLSSKGKKLLPILEEYLGDNIKDFDSFLERPVYRPKEGRSWVEDHLYFRSKALATQVYLRFHATDI